MFDSPSSWWLLAGGKGGGVVSSRGLWVVDPEAVFERSRLRWAGIELVLEREGMV